MCVKDYVCLDILQQEVGATMSNIKYHLAIFCIGKSSVVTLSGVLWIPFT